MYHKRGLWAIKAKNGGSFPHHDPKPKAPASAEKPPKFYPADDVKMPLVNKRKLKPTKLRFFFLCYSFFWAHSTLCSSFLDPVCHISFIFVIIFYTATYIYIYILAIAVIFIYVFKQLYIYFMGHSNLQKI